MNHKAADRKADRIAALMVGLPAVLELALILHHPVPARTIGAAEAANPFGGIAAVIDANRTFHAILILLLAVQLTGLMLLARRLGLHRPLVVAGSVLFALSGVLLLLATTNDGFVLFELISRCSASAAGCGPETRSALTMIFASVQAFTKLGFVGQSFGFAAFAVSLLRSTGQLRLAGAAGLVVSLAPLGFLASGAYIDASLIMQILVAHAILALGAAFLLGSGRLNRLSAADRDNESVA